jgi:PAS domain S-box-containing protein
MALRRDDDPDLIRKELAAFRELAARQEQQIAAISFELTERKKELWCQNEVSRLLVEDNLSPADFYQQVIDIVPQAMCYPEKAAAMLKVHEKVYTSPGYKESTVAIEEGFLISGEPDGLLRVVYLPDSEESANPEFLPDERILLLSLAQRLRVFADKIRKEKALAITRERYRKLVESISDVIFEVSPDGTIRYISPAIRNVSGYEADNLTGMNFLEFIYPDDRPVVADTLQDMGSSGIHVLEFRYLTASGDIRWVRSSVTPVNENGRLVGGRGSLSDIHARKQAELALAESEGKFRRLFEKMAQGVVYQDAAGRIFDANPAAESLLGLTLDQMQGRTSVDPRWRAVRSDGSDFPGELHPAMEALRTSAPVYNVTMGVYHPLRDTYRWILINAEPVFKSAESKPFQVYTTFTDITDLKQSETTLRESESRFRMLFESTPVGIVLDQNDRGVLFVNRKFTEITGYSSGELSVVSDWWRLACPDESYRNEVFAAWECAVGNYLAGSSVFIPLEVKVRCKDGSDKYLEIGYSSEDELNIITCVDVTGRRRSADELREQRNYTESILASIPDLLFIVDSEGTILEYRTNREDKLAFPPHEFMNKSVTEVLPGPVAADFIKGVSAIIKGQDPGPIVYALTVGSEILHFEARLSLLGADRAVVMIRDVTWRIKAREELLESNRKLKLLMNNLRGMAYRCSNDPDRTMEFVSDGVMELTGYASVDLTGNRNMSFNSLICPEDRDRRSEKMHESINKRVPYTLEYRITTAKGGQKWVWERGQAVFEGEKFIALEGFISDVTSRKVAVEKLRKSEEKYRALFFNSPEGYLIISDGRIIECNRASEQLYGGDRSQLLGKSPAMISPEYQPGGSRSEVLAEQYIIEAYETGEKSFEWTNLRYDGSLFLSLVRLAAINYEGKRVLFVSWRDITRQRESEEQIRKLSRAVEQSPVSIVITDLQGNIEYANPRACETTGYSMEEILGQNPRLIKSGMTSEREYLGLWEKISNGHEWKGIFHNRRKNGELYWESSTIAPVTGSDGKITHYLAIKEDITERKKIQESLSESERRFRQVAEHSQTVIWEVNTEGLYTFVSPVSEQVFGYNPVELVGRKYFYELHPDGNREEFKQTVLSIIRKGKETVNFENPIERKDGSVIWVVTNGEPMYDENQKLIGYRGADNDVTQRKQAVDELRKFRAIADQANYGAAIASLDGSLIYINNVLAWQHGWDAADLVGKSLKLFHNQDQMPRVAELLELIKTKGGFKAEVVWHKRKDGSVFPALMNGMLIYDEHMVPKFLSTTMIDITEKLEAEEVIRQQNERLGAIIDAIPDMIFVSDSKGNYLEYYRSSVNTSAKDYRNLVGLNVRDAFDEETAELHCRKISDCLADRQMVTYEYPKVEEGETRYFEGRIVPMDEYRVLRFVRDITKRKKNEQEIRKLTQAIEQSPVAIVITDLNANILYVSPSFTKTTGYSLADVAGKSTRILKSGKTEEQLYRAMWETITADKTWQGEWINKKKNNELYWEKVSISPIFDAQGDKTGYLAVKEDITDRKKADQEIRDLNVNLEHKVEKRTRELAAINEELMAEIEERERFEQALGEKTEELEKFFSVAIDLLCIADITGRFLKLNRAWENTLGYSIEELENSRFLDYVHPEDLESTLNSIGTLREQKTVVGFTNRYRTKSGTYRDIEWHSVPVGLRIYAAARDVTDRISLAKSLEDSILREKELNELKSRFVSMASHEFRTPLASILMAGETLMTYWKRFDDEKIQAKLQGIKDQVKHLNSIVSNVMQVSRIHEGRIGFDPEEIELVSLCKAVIDDFSADKTMKRNIDFSSDFKVMPVLIDKRLMTQVLTNLISNAVKYAQPDPQVGIRLYADGGNIMISVKDNGIGIPEKDQKNLFQPFFRAGNVRAIEGNGLGLNIVRESLLLHGGEITFTSKQGEGSVFYIHLPEKLLM